MSLRALLHLADQPTSPLPKSIRAIEDIRGVRVIRLIGPVGKYVGPDADAADAAAAKAEAVFARPVLFDFKEATDVESATVAYLIRALRRRVAAHMPVGILNAPPRLAAELEITRVQPLFRMFSTEEEAIRQLAGASTSQDRPPP